MPDAPGSQASSIPNGSKRPRGKQQLQQTEKRLFYGWWIVAACFVVNFIVFGISVNTFTVYLKPIETDLGWSRASISMAITLAALAMGAAAPFIGKLIDRSGARVLMAAGAAIVGICTLLLSYANSLPYFYTLFAISGVGQAGATLIPISFVISNWFSVKRARALGVAMTGTGLGAMVMVPITSWIVSTWGWRISYRIMGGLILTVVPVTLLIIRTSPSDLGLLPDGADHTGPNRESGTDTADGLSLGEALRTRAFWLIGSMMVLSGLAAMGVAVHLMPYLTDIGHLDAAAALIISIISGLTVVGKLGLGLLADHRGIRPTIALSYAVMLAGLILLLNAQSFASACVFAVIWGFAIGAPLLLNPTLTAECLGLKNFGAIFGVLTLLNTAGAAAGAVLSGVIYDSVGTYVPAFMLYTVLLAIAGICGVMAQREYESHGPRHANS